MSKSGTITGVRSYSENCTLGGLKLRAYRTELLANTAKDDLGCQAIASTGESEVDQVFGL